MRVLVATDAWRPQVNGVVRTYERLAVEAAAAGAELEFLTPAPYPTLPLPSYPEIRLALVSQAEIARRVTEIAPHFIHIATEGPIGLMTRSWCLSQGHPFTTSYHTRFPDYISARLPLPLDWGYGLQRWFHNSGVGMMVATASLRQELTGRGFTTGMVWTRGVDTALFRPQGVRLFGDDPVFLYVGRVAVEKGIDAFLTADLPGRKVVVGGGPQLGELQARFPEAVFTGPQTGDDLARHYASADVFVFPSRTDTFGIVLLEAMASGVPVAAYPVTGPLDVVADGVSGILGDDLGKAARAALALDREAVRAHATQFSWRTCCSMFLANIVTANAAAGHRPLIPDGGVKIGDPPMVAAAPGAE